MEAISSETARRLRSSDVQQPGFEKSLELLKICQKSQNPSKICCFLCCASSWQLTGGKSCDICKFTRLVANLQDCAPNRSIPPFVSDEGKERRSFTFFWREIRGVCIEKSGGSAFAQIHTHSHHRLNLCILST